FNNGFRPLMLMELFAPWQKSFRYGPWDVLSYLSALGYRFLFACPSGLVEHQPTRQEPFPPAYEDGYNVVAFTPDKHAARIQHTRHLMSGHNNVVLPMSAVPTKNRPG